MKFAEIIKSNSWLSVENIFLELYPDEKKNILGYEVIFNDLKFLQPTDTDISIVVCWAKDDFDNTEYADVSGYNNHPQENPEDSNQSLALEFTSWDQWLGMDLDEKTLKDFTELEIISYCYSK